MDREALKHALLTVGKYLALSVGGGLALWSAIWLPTLALVNIGGWPFLDAYMTGLPVGIIGLCVAYIGVTTYRRKARESA